MTSSGLRVCTWSLLLLVLGACETPENKTTVKQEELRDEPQDGPRTTLKRYVELYGDQPGVWILGPELEGLNMAQVKRQGWDDYFRTHVLKTVGVFNPTKPAVFHNLKGQKVQYTFGPAGGCFNGSSCVHVTLPDVDAGSPQNFIPVTEALFEYRKANPLP